MSVRGRTPVMTTELSKVDQHTWDSQEAYLTAFAGFGTLTKSSQSVGLHRDTVRRWEHGDVQGFRQRLREAQKAYADYLEGLALLRVQNPEGNRGSDTLLIALNNANNPDKWRGNNVTVEVSDQLLSYMQKRQAEDGKALPPAETVLEHAPEVPPWSEK